MPTSRDRLHAFVRNVARQGRLVVQPRMGFGSLGEMKLGLVSVMTLPFATVGTITLDSYTRQGDYRSALRSLETGAPLNGFPIMCHPISDVGRMLEGPRGEGFPIQVRHGTAEPQAIFRRLVALGLTNTEGGPVSYCLPYSRVALRDAVRAWKEGCGILAGESEDSHVESFGGCLLGQLCPPSLRVAMSILEALFLRQQGIGSVSLSYAQGTSLAQDTGALLVMRGLASAYLFDLDWHTVLYTYMGVFPRSTDGARRLIRDSAMLARATGTERLIVKTASESRGIPSIADNLEALTLASETVAPASRRSDANVQAYGEEIRHEAESMICAVLSLDRDIGRALVRAFGEGWLDIPYCMHADNRGTTSTRIDGQGALRWKCEGRLPFARTPTQTVGRPSSAELLENLNYIREKYDAVSASEEDA